MRKIEQHGCVLHWCEGKKDVAVSVFVVGQKHNTVSKEYTAGSPSRHASKITVYLQLIQWTCQINNRTFSAGTMDMLGNIL
jgi:hypothetical protein